MMSEILCLCLCSFFMRIQVKLTCMGMVNHQHTGKSVFVVFPLRVRDEIVQTNEPGITRAHPKTRLQV